MLIAKTASRVDPQFFEEAHAQLGLTDSATGAAAHGPPTGYNLDPTHLERGEAKAVFEAAIAAFRFRVCPTSAVPPIDLRPTSTISTVCSPAGAPSFAWCVMN